MLIVQGAGWSPARWICLLLLLVSLAFITQVSHARESVSLIGPFAGWGDTLQEALDRFALQHDVDVELINVTEGGWAGVREKVATMTAGGIAPDVLYGDNWTLDFYALNQLSQPLDPYVERDIDLSRYPQTVLDVAFRHHGHLWGLPTALSVLNLYYNADHFESHGLASPPFDWSAEGFTWDDFVDAAVKLTKDENGDGEPEQFGTAGWGWTPGLNMLGLWDLHMMDPDGTEFYGDSPEIVEALDTFAALWTQYNVVGGNWRNGSAAMATANAGALNAYFEIEDFTWNAAAVPKGKQRSSETGFHGISMSHGTRNPELAWKLIKYLTYESEGSVLFTQAENRVPVLKDALAEMTERWEGRLSSGSIASLIGATNYVYDTHFSRHPNGPSLFVPLLFEAGRKIAAGEQSARQAMDELAPRARAILSER